LAAVPFELDMGLVVRESSIQVLIEDLEEGPIDPSNESYPYPILIKTGRLVERTLPVIEATNPFFRLLVAPTLGGRILTLTDLRSDNSLPPLPERLEAVSESARRATIPHGIQLTLNGQERLTASGPVDAVVRDEGDSAEVLLAEASSYPLSWHLSVSVSADSPQIELEARIFNRTLDPVEYNAGLYLGSAGVQFSRTTDGFVAWVPEQRGGYVIQSDGLTHALSFGRRVSLTRFAQGRLIAPHQLDTWKVVLTPLGGFSALPRIAGRTAFSITQEEIRVAAISGEEPLKVLILTPDGETLEAPVLATVREVKAIPLGDLAPTELVILDEHRQELVRTAPGEPMVPFAPSSPAEPEPLKAGPALEWPRQMLEEASFRLEHRAICEYLLGLLDLRGRHFESAAQRFEEALLFNAEDHLAWWLKAAASRHTAEEPEPGPELPNAHFLAPMEPALRAESLLGQPIQGDRTGNPLVAPFAKDREGAIDVACHLIEAGLYGDANRFLDEVRRHVDFPILRYLMAYTFLIGSRLDAEAAQQVAAAARLAAEPPYPIRPMEREALSALSARFSGDRQLEYYAGLALRAAARA